MNNQQISNPKTEVPTGIELNDKDYITSLLTCLKDIEKNYFNLYYLNLNLVILVIAFDV